MVADNVERLKPCPASPNCVSSQADPADTKHYIEPLRLSTESEHALAVATEIVVAMPRTRLKQKDEAYLHAEVRSLIFRFVDDLEIVVDSSRALIHFRSASRLGNSILGVNRRRLETFRAALQAKLKELS